jgi:hypothetical protein
MRALREAGVTAQVVVRADSAFFSAKLVRAIRAAGALFSISKPSTRSWPISGRPDSQEVLVERSLRHRTVDAS